MPMSHRTIMKLLPRLETFKLAYVELEEEAEEIRLKLNDLDETITLLERVNLVWQNIPFHCWKGGTEEQPNCYLSSPGVERTAQVYVNEHTVKDGKAVHYRVNFGQSNGVSTAKQGCGPNVDSYKKALLMAQKWVGYGKRPKGVCLY